MKISCRHQETKMSGRGGFPSVWVVRCKKAPIAGRRYCEKHAPKRAQLIDANAPSQKRND